MKGWLATVESLPCNWPGNHATGVRGRLRFDRSLPKSAYVSLRRKGSQVRKGNPTTTVIPRVDESKPSHRSTEDLSEPQNPREPNTFTFDFRAPLLFLAYQGS